jgi:hypothetical protein
MLRRKISSDTASLDELYQEYKWIPNSLTIRPHPDVLVRKLLAMQEIDEKWMSCKDYILFKVFGRQTKMICNRLYVENLEVDASTKIFQLNEFPYAIEEGNHWVLWYGSTEKCCSDENITSDVYVAIKGILNGSEAFDFAWYENPKMSVPEFFHVQVFWTAL